MWHGPATAHRGAIWPRSRPGRLPGPPSGVAPLRLADRGGVTALCRGGDRPAPLGTPAQSGIRSAFGRYGRTDIELAGSARGSGEHVRRRRCGPKPGAGIGREWHRKPLHGFGLPGHCKRDLSVTKVKPLGHTVAITSPDDHRRSMTPTTSTSCSRARHGLRQPSACSCGT
jgi:hypothetical protein